MVLDSLRIRQKLIGNRPGKDSRQLLRIDFRLLKRKALSKGGEGNYSVNIIHEKYILLGGPLVKQDCIKTIPRNRGRMAESSEESGIARGTKGDTRQAPQASPGS